MTVDELLTKYRNAATSEADKGAQFEQLMQKFLLTYPDYLGEIEEVMPWNKFSGERDLGIDLVAKTKAGEYWAVQCKFYAEGATIDKGEVDSFISNSGRIFDGRKFSLRIFISTSSNFTPNAQKMLENQTPPVVQIGMKELREANIDWVKLDAGITGKPAAIPRNLREYQQDAINAAHEYFQTHERGKLIMACGTGKTFTALKIAEDLTGGRGLVLFLVPSLSLMGQTLHEWASFAENPFNTILVCSDETTAKSDDDLIKRVNLPIPPTSDTEKIAAEIKNFPANQLTVIFSTYQSIQKVIDAKLNFDLTICDEAHRTAGYGKESKLFAKVHKNENINSKLRLYMTATPRYTKESNKNPANDEKVWSMDDTNIFGEEFFQISFKRAIELGCLSDYQVLIFSVSEGEVQAQMRDSIAEKVQAFIDKLNSERAKTAKEIKFSFTVDDMAKLVGTINALSKRVTDDSKYLLEGDFEPMHKALAFLPKIIDSEVTAEILNHFEEIYLPEDRDELIKVEAKHIDGSDNSKDREDAINKLKNTPADRCTVISNVRCLSEGVDVPSLDAVIFLAPKKSKIDIVQAVGRALRIAPDKKFGYIIVPIIAPTVINGETKNYYEANNEKYRTIYEVLQSIKMHDESIVADIERLSLTGTSNRIKVIESKDSKKYSPQLPFEIFKTELIAKVVDMNGNKSYWWHWAQKVSVIVQRHTDAIQKLIAIKDSPQARAFNIFVNDLQKIINPTVTENDAVDMLAQHLVTRPVFEALFENYSFAANNPVSKSMNQILRQLDNSGLENNRAELQNFYDRVKEMCRNMGDAKNRQKIITNLYDSFFRMALPLTAQKLGIVYTPVEVVDFILNSVSDVLKKHFGCTISSKNVHILDPFTGTGTFISRLIQSGLINPADLLRKYQNELHANEIVLLAYYIAAINIENAFHEVFTSTDFRRRYIPPKKIPPKSKKIPYYPSAIPTPPPLDNKSQLYIPFDGICFTDTFQSYENAADPAIYLSGFENPLRENAALIKNQLDTEIKIIVGNPPYSVGQRSANDNAQNNSYPKIERRISETYAKGTNATNKNALYDSYIKAFRWASDRIGNSGIIAFVTNAGWLDGAAMDGLRECFEQDFTEIYIFNLRGNQRTQGETSRREGGKIFGSGSRAPIAITVLVKSGNLRDSAQIFYCDIGDYLSRDEKLAKIKAMKSVLSDEFKILTPNDKGDWINQRGNRFENFIPLGDKKNNSPQTFFCEVYGNGIETKRDAWAYNFSKSALEKNIQTTIDFYNSNSPENRDSTKFSWSMKSVNNKKRGREYKFDGAKILESMYRPFCKEYLYYDQNLNDVVGQIPKIFPTGAEENLVIDISGVSGSKDFSVMIFDKIPCYDAIEKGQCFPLYWYAESREDNLFEPGKKSYARRSGVSEYILAKARGRYGFSVSAEDIFYYVYGFLHVGAYRREYAADLKKSLPRIILVDSAEDFWRLRRAGSELAAIHLNYERQPAAAVEVEIRQENYRVQKMKLSADKKTLIYNEYITIKNIPARAFEYVVNGRSPLEWIIDRYRVKTDTASQIVNDPNFWASEHGNPRYILDLILSCITVSLKTLEIVENLPEINFE